MIPLAVLILLKNALNFIHKKKKKNPKRRELNLRKWISNCSGILKLMNC